jgi:predicted RNA binding protein YcfA (HicA-like mRNA interferase family)
LPAEVPKLPGVNHRDAVRALQRAGFRVAREGKHIVMTNGQRIVTIPRHDPVNAYTMGGIVQRYWVDDRRIQNNL